MHMQGFYLHQENRIFFYNDFGVGCKKVFVAKAYISDDTKSVCYNAKFIGIAEMSVHIHLLNGRICGSMRRHGAIGKDKVDVQKTLEKSNIEKIKIKEESL